jgi:serpin B
MRMEWSLRYGMGRILVAVVAAGMLTSSCGAAVDDSIGVVLLPSSGVQRVDLDRSAPFAELAAGFNDAGFDFWRTQPAEDNLVFSPASVGHALLMARAAADTPTGSAIDAAFALPVGRAAHEAWNSIDHMIASDAESDEALTVRIADRIWPAIDVKPSPEWIDLLASHHGATVQTLDFPRDPESSRNVINSWVSDQTEGLIAELIPDGMINEETFLMLTDTIYFKAGWAMPFSEAFNVSDEFTLLDGTTVETEYLHRIDSADRTAVGDGFLAAELFYVGGDFAMVVILPDEGFFEDLRDRLDQDLINEIDRQLTVRPYELLLPKWKTTANFDLEEWLTELNISPGSYPGIDPEAFIGGAVHAADITVDEWGTVAAAATAIEYSGSEPSKPELVIRADRPFLYLIRHQPTGLNLFAGQVTNPAATQPESQ